MEKSYAYTPEDDGGEKKNRNKILAFITAALLVIAGAGFGVHHYASANSAKKACEEATEAFNQTLDSYDNSTDQLKEVVDLAEAKDAHGFADTDTGKAQLDKAKEILDSAKPAIAQCGSKADAQRITDSAKELELHNAQITQLATSIQADVDKHIIDSVAKNYAAEIDDNNAAREDAKKAIERGEKSEKYTEAEDHAKLIAELKKLLEVTFDKDLAINDVATARKVEETSIAKIVENTKATREAKDKLSESIDTHEKKLAEEKKAAEEKAAAEKAAQQNAPKRGNGSYQAPAPKRSGGAQAPKANKGGNKYHKPAPAPARPKPAPAPAKPKPAPARPAPQKPAPAKPAPAPAPQKPGTGSITGPPAEDYTCEEGKISYQNIGDKTFIKKCVGGKWATIGTKP